MNEALRTTAGQAVRTAAARRFAADYVGEVRIVLAQYRPLSEEGRKAARHASAALAFGGPVETHLPFVGRAADELTAPDDDPGGWFTEVGLALYAVRRVLAAETVTADDMEELGHAWNRIQQIRDALSAS